MRSLQHKQRLTHLGQQTNGYTRLCTFHGRVSDPAQVTIQARSPVETTPMFAPAGRSHDSDRHRLTMVAVDLDTLSSVIMALLYGHVETPLYSYCIESEPEGFPVAGIVIKEHYATLDISVAFSFNVSRLCFATISIWRTVPHHNLQNRITQLSQARSCLYSDPQSSGKGRLPPR